MRIRGEHTNKKEGVQMKCYQCNKKEIDEFYGKNKCIDCHHIATGWVYDKKLGKAVHPDNYKEGE